MALFEKSIFINADGSIHSSEEGYELEKEWNSRQYKAIATDALDIQLYVEIGLNREQASSILYNYVFSQSLQENNYFE